MRKLFLTALLVVSLQVRNVLSENKCGISQSKKTGYMVHHGLKAAKGAWPWHVAVYHVYGRKEEYVCGGTLVTKQHVLTAAHCVEDTEENLLSLNIIIVRLGVHNLRSTQINEIQRRRISNIYSGRLTTVKQLKNDIAILKLASEAEFGSYVQPACVSRTEDFKKHNGTVVGWGLDENDQVPDVLNMAILPVVEPFECLSSNPYAFGPALDPGHFCAGYTNGTTVCNGDSGGGIFFKENGAWHVGGIVSFTALRDDGSIFCDKNSYSVFTRIHTHLSWIESVTKLKIRDGQLTTEQMPEPQPQPLYNSRPANFRWVPWAAGPKPPRHAIFAGNNWNKGELYVGRVRHNGQDYVVKASPKERNCYLAYEGKVVHLKRCEVLTGSGLSWVQYSSDGDLPANAFACGTKANGKPQLIGRVDHPWKKLPISTTPGTIDIDSKQLSISFGDREFWYSNYDVLVVD